MSRSKWGDTWYEDPSEIRWCNALRYFWYNAPNLEYYCLLKQDRNDGKWYAHTAQTDVTEDEINKSWVLLDVNNLREAKKVVEVMARMEG